VAAKLCLLIVALGITGLSLLQIRQARLQAVHDLAQIQRQMLRDDRSLFELRTQIARAVTPARVHELAAKLGPMRPLGIDPLPGTGAELAGGEAGDGAIDPTKPVVQPAVDRPRNASDRPRSVRPAGVGAGGVPVSRRTGEAQRP
jgi:hypothetical protein